MSIASPADLLDALQRLHLLEPAQHAELAALVQQGPLDARSLARDLVRRGWLTPFQVNQVFLGRGKDLLLGSYVLLEKLAEGGMGSVYKARNWKLGQVVALKVIRKDHADREATIRRFGREIRHSAQFDHPHIVKTLDADDVDGSLLLVMEYVEGSDLGKVVRERGPLPFNVAAEFIRQAAIGLQHAHEHGMVHRDIKPGNLILTTRADAPSTVKLLDLGLARVVQGAGADSSLLTVEGFVMGSLDFMAPEQARDSHNVDIRADLYALGCTLYYLLTGQTPFPGGSAYDKMYRHQFEPPPPLENVRRDIPPALSAIVYRLLAKKREDRFQTPAELVEALTAFVHGPPVVSAPVAILVDPQAHLETAGPSTQAFARRQPSRAALLRARLLRYRVYIAIATGVLIVLLLILLLMRVAAPRSRGGTSSRSESARADGVTSIVRDSHFLV